MSARVPCPYYPVNWDSEFSTAAGRIEGRGGPGKLPTEAWATRSRSREGSNRNHGGWTAATLKAVTRRRVGSFTAQRQAAVTRALRVIALTSAQRGESERVTKVTITGRTLIKVTITSRTDITSRSWGYENRRRKSSDWRGRSRRSPSVTCMWYERIDSTCVHVYMFACK